MTQTLTIYLDITNLLQQNFLTGIQRVVREVAVRLLNCYGLNLRLLRVEPDGQHWSEVDPRIFQDALAGHRVPAAQRGALFSITELAPGVWYDLDAVWGSPVPRSWLYPMLRQQGIQVVTFVHDCIPITDPQYCDLNTVCQFMNYMGAVLTGAGCIFVSTQATATAIQMLQCQAHSTARPVVVTGLGADFASRSSRVTVSPKVTAIVQGAPYVLLVSTLEPRKNHRVLLDAFDQGLFDRGLALVFAGRIGWGVSELLARIQNHPRLGRGLYHLSGLNDASVDVLYHHAFLAAYPSFNEGFGLPIIEALERGVPVVAADRDVLREVGQDFCLYCDPNVPEQWHALLAALADDPARMSAWRARLAGYQAPTWDEAVAQMAQALRHLPG
ncbi:glycosyltransferase family 1 protein [uncultured Gemmiger sp.]|uniref:glycosyltransferase family 4 protein n=1 Tax=uncultured Gemmiger sp. TaxID=1623490 RepID=UPI0025DE41D6|nr:glycosyltransferase family 1 protein [uncultured Gemmiger sp.]